MRNPAGCKRGFILLTAYMIMTSMSIYALALFARASVFMQTTEHNKKKLVAFNAAEAGFDDAYQRIKNNQITSYPWASGYVSLDTGNIEGGYSTTVTDLGNNVKKIAITGYSPSQSTTVQSQELRPVTGYVQSIPSSAFNNAIFAADSVTLNGSTFNLVDTMIPETGITAGRMWAPTAI